MFWELLAASTEGMPTWAVFIVVPVFVFLFALSWVKYRQRGPAVHWVPKRWRDATNRHFESRGWEPPYDKEGKKRSAR